MRQRGWLLPLTWLWLLSEPPADRSRRPACRRWQRSMRCAIAHWPPRIPAAIATTHFRRWKSMRRAPTACCLARRASLGAQLRCAASPLPWSGTGPVLWRPVVARLTSEKRLRVLHLLPCGHQLGEDANARPTWAADRRFRMTLVSMMGDADGCRLHARAGHQAGLNRDRKRREAASDRRAARLGWRCPQVEAPTEPLACVPDRCAASCFLVRCMRCNENHPTAAHCTRISARSPDQGGEASMVRRSAIDLPWVGLVPADAVQVAHAPSRTGSITTCLMR